MSDTELAARIDASAHLATAEFYLDRFEDSRAHAERALGVARATGQQFPTLVPTLASALFMRGRLVEAVAVIVDGVDAARLANNPRDLAWRLQVRSSAALAVGDLETARATAEEAFELTAHLGGFVAAYPGYALAGALLQCGDAAGAVEAMVSRAGGEELPVIHGVWRVSGLALLSSCRLELGDREDAARTADLAADAAEALGLDLGHAWAQRAAAALALAAGKPGDAADRARASTDAAERAGAVVEAALSRTMLGEALAAAGDVEAGVAELRSAATTFDALGAVRYRDAAERELRRHGERIHRQTRPGDADAGGVRSLTERELEVARLVVDRKTNAEIAGELFLSVKTVESHLRNLFRKLDVSSRVDVARAIERSDLNQGS
jgi:ATP/maltotriose-dependent transcriptional regulator MalT